MKPLDGFDCRRVNAHILHPCDEVQGVAAMFALAETIPCVFADADTELSRIAAFVDRAWTAQPVSAPFEFVQETVMIEHLLHGDGRFDGSEVNEL